MHESFSTQRDKYVLIYLDSRLRGNDEQAKPSFLRKQESRNKAYLHFHIQRLSYNNRKPNQFSVVPRNDDSIHVIFVIPGGNNELSVFTYN